jgi:hypothetical protein
MAVENDMTTIPEKEAALRKNAADDMVLCIAGTYDFRCGIISSARDAIPIINAKDTEIADLRARVEEKERYAKATTIMLAAMEAHMSVKTGLTGVDHADEGHRIRRALQAFLGADEAMSILRNDASSPNTGA